MGRRTGWLAASVHHRRSARVRLDSGLARHSAARAETETGNGAGALGRRRTAARSPLLGAGGREYSLYDPVYAVDQLDHALLRRDARVNRAAGEPAVRVDTADLCD